ncbi:MAG: hypothetical protein JO263_00125 [Candidatus Eremiobacteraeota bacterium]|nr:hypothetical protein [Candidatus Eremiobacteraeota bacterium]
MLRYRLSRSSFGVFGVVIAVALLSGCGGQSAVMPSQAASFDSAQRDMQGVLPDVVPPPNCKGQRNTKKYSYVKSQNMKAAGGSLCVPAYQGWGGALGYPSINQAYKVELISSTKPYNAKLFPPKGSQTPIFYLQYVFNGFPVFGTTLGASNPLESIHVTPKKSYTAQLWEKIGSGLWSSLAECYVTAKKSKFGGALGGIGAVFAGQFYREPSGVIEIFSGALVGNHC